MLFLGLRPRVLGCLLLFATHALVGCGASQPPAQPASLRSIEPSSAAPSLVEPAPATPIADQYREVAGRIMAAALADTRAYERLAHLSDRIGARLSGSEALERAIAWAAQVMAADGHDNVHTEKVMVPHWVRGHESAQIVSPVARELSILGLGGTVGTGPKGLTAEVVVVEDFDELEGLGQELAGKIVLYNKVMPAYHPEHGPGYGKVVEYRVKGPSRAAKLGARGVLVRSLTNHSLRSPHTGGLRYLPDAPKIPAAAVTTEDADLIARLAAAGETVRVRMKLGAKTLPDKESANVIAELRGRERPEEIVLIGAHIDSWDVGQGAHDDGAGCVMMMQALTLLRELGLEPRRTIRVVLFTNEENGLRGARAYFKDHAHEADDHVMAMESDTGSFAPRGFKLQGNEAARAQLEDIITLLRPLDAARVVEAFAGADLIPLTRHGVPSLGLWMDMSTYFDIHHTHADTFDKIDPEHLVQNIAAVAITAYVIADMPERFGGDVQ